MERSIILFDQCVALVLTSVLQVCTKSGKEALVERSIILFDQCVAIIDGSAQQLQLVEALAMSALSPSW